MSAGPGRFSPRLLLVLWERESLSVSDRPASLGHSWLLRENEGDMAGSKAKRDGVPAPALGLPGCSGT